MVATLRRSWHSWLTLVGLCLAVLVGWIFTFPPRGAGHDGPDDEHGPIVQPQNALELQITLGLKDEQQELWKGEIKLSEGKLLKLDIVQAARDSTVAGATFSVKSAKQAAAKKAKRKTKQQAKQNTKKKQTDAAEILAPARLRALVDAPASASVTVTTSRGEFSFALMELMLGESRLFLDGQASVLAEAGALPLTGKSTEDDFPALARGADGTIWLAYVEYKPGPALVADRVLNGNFDALLPSGNGDQIRLLRFDGKTWQPQPPVTDGLLDVWRPTVTVDGTGGVWVAWAQKTDGDWNIVARRYQPGQDPQQPGVWGDLQTISKSPGSDFHVVAATDAQGKVWLAWQSWQTDNYDILLHAVGSGGSPKKISRSAGHDWSPAIAADSQGRVYVAWDSYDKNNYDVLLHVEGGDQQRPVAVADSPRFEARVSLYCDRQDRLWVAYEEGDEQWGKDYASDDGYRKIGLENNPGFALYINRTVRVVCRERGEWKQPQGDLEAAWSEVLKRNKSLPRLMGDAAGGLWLLVRHHPLAAGGGEAWHSYGLRWNGVEWSSPREIPSSSNLLDNRPALVPYKGGVLVVASSDSRANTAGRGQDDLYASVLNDPESISSQRLAAVSAAPPAQVKDVHENELELVKRLRKYRLSVGGKNLRIVRGEFHRHTEFTAHRDQDGMLEDSWRYALDAGRLDWMGNGDHDNGGGHEYMWWINQKQCDLHHNPPHFVAAMTYERSNTYPNGHRNVMMPERGIRPLPRGDLKGTPEDGTPDTKMLYAYLKHFGSICASHTSGTNMGTDWRDNDPEVEPVVEIYQGHRHNYEHFGAPRSATAQTQIGGYQPAGFIWNALEKGYKLGFQSSSDHVSTHMSYAAVFATDNSRQAIIDAFKKRHSYGATDNILLVVRSGEHMMGDIFTTSSLPKISIEAAGGRPIAKVSIVRDNKYVYTNEPQTAEVRREYTDMDVKAGESHYYYVRVEQEDGNLAWASPLWITYQP